MARRDRLRADVRALLERDPATERALKAILTSPGLWARWTHRLASWLWVRDRRLLARVLITIARLVTGVELHPAAEIGDRVVIDHGQGVVVGETATIRHDVLLFHGVTLGARADGARKREPDRGGRRRRHPTVGDGVTLGARATVLGPIEVGDDATVGAGAVVVDDVPAGETVVGVPAEQTDTVESTGGGVSNEDADSNGEGRRQDADATAEGRRQDAETDGDRHCSPST